MEHGIQNTQCKLKYPRNKKPSQLYYPLGNDPVGETLEVGQRECRLLWWQGIFTVEPADLSFFVLNHQRPSITVYGVLS